MGKVVGVASPGGVTVMRALEDRLAIAEKRIQDLEASEHRYRQLVEGSPEPVIVHIDGRIAFANSAGAHALGLAAADELIGRSVLEFATAVSHRAIEHRIASETDRGDAFDLAERAVLRETDGREVHAEIRSIPLVYEGQAATLSIARDITRRVHAERLAASSHADAELARRHLEAVLSSLPLGVWILDATGTVTKANPAAATTWAGEPPFGDPATMLRTLATGETVNQPLDIVRSDGTVGHVISPTAPIRDDHGRTIGGVIVVHDVTVEQTAARERERLIATLEFERRRLVSLLESTPAFIAAMRGKDHVFTLANEACCALAGRHDLVGRSLVEALPEVAGQGFVEMLDHVLATGETVVRANTPVMLARTAGMALEQRFVNLSYQPILEADGSTSGVFAHGIDVTDAVLGQQRTRSQFNAIPVPIYVWERIDRDGSKQFVMTDFNDAAMTMSGGAIEKHRGESAHDFFVDDPECIVEIERCLDDGVTFQREFDRKLRSTGEVKRLLVTYAKYGPLALPSPPSG